MRTCFIVNPASGQSQHLFGSPIEEIVAFFAGHGLSIALKTTAKPGDGAALARESVLQGYTHIVACGGDGTINEVINGIEGTDAVLGIVPLGTVNVLAGAMSVPSDVTGACRHFLEAPERRIDLGAANGRTFVIMSGIGFDAQVMAETDPALKRLLGSLGYIMSGGVRLLTAEDGRMHSTISLHDSGEVHEVDAWFILVGNLASYSPAVSLALNARPDDGLLDIVVFPLAGAIEWFAQVMSALTASHLDTGQIRYFTSSNFTIASDPALPFHLDGEPSGLTPVRYEVRPGALKVRF